MLANTAVETDAEQLQLIRSEQLLPDLAVCCQVSLLEPWLLSSPVLMLT